MNDLMERELKDLSSKTTPQPQHSLPPLSEAECQHPPSTSAEGGASAEDDRPLLKPDEPAAITPSEIRELEKKFAAYVRNDAYGSMGCGVLPLREKILIGIALFTLAPLRVVLAITVLMVYYLICLVCTALKVPNRDGVEEQEDYAHLSGWRRPVIVGSGRFFSRVLLFVFGFYWISETHRSSISPGEEKPITEISGEGQPRENVRPGAIISNHVSYLDILYHMSSSFPSFVAKRSVANLPLVGLISKCLGCVYVQRESKSSDFKGVSGVVNQRVQEAHKNKDAPVMMLFPEGTTTNGEYLLPFKTGAFWSKAPVLPVILRYPYKRFSPAWDSISGVRHVIFLLCQFTNYMEVIHLPVYYPSQQEKDDPKLYANNVRRLMASEVITS
ncbi:hypothetical protein SAY86_011490 [Trapa natans]|uniref:Phospholipid/glycerol acyltransferase domain-containing protein n=1 Tax=Trapa natans TaxID=22666 RepID=A0AAN7LX56_TRANT|nr:hypothetical protein SAY86_011490 [Trapa natans]